jgi:Plexin cytoplasmic RasGAP domain
LKTCLNKNTIRQGALEVRVTFVQFYHFSNNLRTSASFFQMSLQPYIDDLFRTILEVNNATPVAIKYLFDLFDSAVARYDIPDPAEVTHTWKSNRSVII